MVKRALVLSGGGMFGAWQAGAWRALAQRFKPDLVVGASVGSLNGYAIASGVSPDQLCDRWLHSREISLGRLNEVAASLTARPIETDFAVVVVDLLRMKPVVVRGSAVTAAHLVASCAVPLAKLPVKIDGRWYLDGGLLNPLPVFAAVDLGATQILALHALPRLPGVVLPALAKPFYNRYSHRPPTPSQVKVVTIAARPLGSLLDALRWKEDNVRRWLKEGAETAEENISALDCFQG